MGAWQQIAPMPEPLYRAAACWHDGKVYVFNGQKPNSGLSQTTYIYDPTTNTWSAGSVVPELAMSNWGGYAFSAGDHIHLLASTGKHYRYTPATNSWATRAPNSIANRDRCFAFQDASERIYLVGGRDPGNGSSISGAVERYTPSTNTWETLSTTAGSINEYNIGIVGQLGNNGKFYTGAHGLGTLLIWDPVAMTWDYTTPPETNKGVAYNLPSSRLADGTMLALPAVWPFYSELRRRVDGYNTATGLWTKGVIPDFPGVPLDFPAVATDPTGFVYYIGGQNNYNTTVSQAAYVYLENRVPNAPVLTTMTGGALVSTASPNRAAHTFNDPDTGDSQSKFEVRYRLVGDVTWTTVVVPWPNPFYDFPAGTFVEGDFERQVRTWDAGGLVGPWCASGFFTAADPPAGPSITYPINGQDAEQVETLVWSTAEQDVYQVRRVGDDDGVPDESVVYYDSGEVTAPLIRSLPLTFETNGRAEHIQVRVKFEGLWSVYISVMVNVDYSEPPVPSFVIYPDPETASLLLMITNPVPVGDEPDAAYVNVYVTEGGVEERKATELSTNTGWRYWTPVSGRDYTAAIRVEAVAANGATASTP